MAEVGWAKEGDDLLTQLQKYMWSSAPTDLTTNILVYSRSSKNMNTMAVN